MNDTLPACFTRHGPCTSQPAVSPPDSGSRAAGETRTPRGPLPVSMQFIRQLIARIKAWRWRRQQPPLLIPLHMHLTSYSTAIHRDVTPNGVRVYSLCGCCGARLEASATLCDECAQKRSGQTRPY